MIVYGMRSTHLQSFDASVTCASCGQRDKTVVSIFDRYAHIFWIPLFPVGKTAVAYCENCEAVHDELSLFDKKKALSADLKAVVKPMKADTRAPKWQYSGLGVIALLGSYGFYANGQTQEANARYLANPLPGDRYEYRIQEDGKNRYTLFKVAAVSKDTLWVYENQYTIDKKTQLDKIDLRENFSTRPTPVLRTEVTAWQQQGDIMEITR